MNNLYKELQDIASANALPAPYMNSIPNMGKNCNALAAVNARCAELQAAYAKQAPSIQQAFELYAQMYPVLQQFAKAYPSLCTQVQAATLKPGKENSESVPETPQPMQDLPTTVDQLNELVNNMPMPENRHIIVNKKKLLEVIGELEIMLSSLLSMNLDDNSKNLIFSLLSATVVIAITLKMNPASNEESKPTQNTL